MIKVIYINQGDSKDKPMVADVEHGLAIHPLYVGEEDGEWVLTHVPTGRNLGIYSGRAQSEILRSLIADLVDWDGVGFVDEKATGIPSEIRDLVFKLQAVCKQSELL